MDEYCLRWNNHQPNLVTVFSELLTSEALVDVTLATDGKFIHAHKLVLSACSSYFKDLFASNPCKHPIVFLKDVRFEDLRTVVDFIYKGEVNVSQERLQDVVKTAESLKIKGLADTNIKFDERSSQNRGHHLSSSFSSQRSSLTDSREHTTSTDAEKDPLRSSPPANKKRKIISQESSESTQGNSHDEETQSNSENKEDMKTSVETSSREDKNANFTEVKIIKTEDDPSHSSEGNPEYQESRAADAMLMLQSSSSETEVGTNPEVTCSTNSSVQEGSSSVVGTHSQGRSGGKRATLQRQPGIIREVATEEPRKDTSIADTEVTVFSPRIATDDDKSKNNEGEVSKSMSGNTKLLQVPAVVVGSHDSSNSFSLSSGHSKQVSSSHSKQLLVVPSNSSGQVIKQSSLTESSSSGPPPITKQSSHPGVLTHTTTVSLDRTPSTTTSGSLGNQVAILPIHLIQKQKSSTSSLSSQSHLRPIQPKPTIENEFWQIKKESPIIQFTYMDDELLPYNPRLPRANSEEPALTRTTVFDSLSPGPSPLIQSVSQDTGLDATVGISRLVPPPTSLSNIRQAGTTSVSHTPVLRDGPALGCNFCWNTQDTQGRVQRRKTKYHCPDCRTNLCIVPCFHEFHSQMQVKQDQHKQITKMLTKTSSM